jgi:hypothetical protein
MGQAKDGRGGGKPVLILCMCVYYINTCVLAVLEVELRASCMLGRHSCLRHCASPFCIGYVFEMGSQGGRNDPNIVCAYK